MLDKHLLVMTEMQNQLQKMDSQLQKTKGLIPYLLNANDTPYSDGDYLLHFEAMMERTVERHGMEVYRVIQDAIDTARNFGLDIEKPQIKAFITNMICSILDA